MKESCGFLRVEYLFMLIVALFWAIPHPLGRIILKKIHPFQLASVNLIIGLGALLIYLVFSRKLGELFRLGPKDTVLSLLLGVFAFFFYQMFTFSALARIPASMNAILVSTNVILIAVLAVIFLGEKVSFFRAFGIASAAAGVFIITTAKNPAIGGNIEFLGPVFSILAALCFAIYAVMGKRVLSRNDPLIVSTLALFSGMVLITIFTLATVGGEGLAGAGRTVWGILVPLSVAYIGVAYPLWFFSLKRLPASHISVYIYMTPVFAVILSLVILKESLSSNFWIGSFLVLVGIVSSNISSPRLKNRPS
ncbi:MAG: DMT family transporter [Spirochaetota bacterium]